MTSPDRHSRAQELFEEAEALPAGERDAFLRSACADDSDLRREVVRLLEAAAEMPEDFLEPSRPPPAPQIDFGEALAHYKILDRLGAGGMGDVYLAEDEHLKRRIALKVLPPELAASPQRLARFQREAETVAALNHPNIVTIYSIENAGGVHFLTMELVEGRSLREVIDDTGALPVDQVLDLGVQIAEGLAEAHAAGIVHRDLKPGNVMVAPNGRVKLLDFGLALPDQPLRDASRSGGSRPAGKRPLTREGTILGTVAYMSPEQLTGRRADFRSDLFSLGILLFELASGRHPFPAETETSRLAKILEREPENLLGIRPELPRPLERIVGRCLEKDPAERYQDPAELARKLGELRLAEASGGLRARTLRRRYPVRPSRKLVIAAMALSGLALIAVVIWYIFLRPPPESLAVLPMHNISENPEESDYLARGISEAVTTKLARAGLPVTPWDTVRRIDPTQPAEQIASELGVEALLTGTFRIVEDRLHATHKLIDLKRNRVIGIGDFHGPFEDIFAIQRQVALRVSEELEARLTAREQEVLEEPESRNADAYDYYLQGVDFLREGGRQATEVAREYFRRALQLDPELADAHIGLGAAHSTLYFNLWGRPDHLRTAEESYLAALQLEPASMRARRGLIHVEGERGHSAEVLIHAREARRLGHPNDVENLFAQAEAYTYAGLTDLALPIFRDIVALDPLNEAASWWLVLASAWSGDFDGAVAAGQAYLGEFGDDPMVDGWLGVSLYAQGHHDRAEEHYRRAIGSTPGLTSNLPSLSASLALGHLLQKTGRHAEAAATWRTGLGIVRGRQAEVSSSPRLVFLRAAFETCLSGRPSDEGLRHLSSEDIRFSAEVYQLAATHARQGDWDRSIELLHWALDQGSTFPVWTGHFWSFGLDPETAELLGFRRALAKKERELRRSFGPRDPFEGDFAR